MITKVKIKIIKIKIIYKKIKMQKMTIITIFKNLNIQLQLKMILKNFYNNKNNYNNN